MLPNTPLFAVADLFCLGVPCRRKSETMGESFSFWTIQYIFALDCVGIPSGCSPFTCLIPIITMFSPGRSPCWESHADVQFNILDWTEIVRKIYRKSTESKSALYGNCTENIWKSYGKNRENVRQKPQNWVNEYFPDTVSESSFLCCDIFY